MNKQALLDAAEVLDAFRIIPRFILVGYAWLLYDAEVWFRSLPAPTSGQEIAHGAIWGAATLITGWYFNTGRKWQ